MLEEFIEELREDLEDYFEDIGKIEIEEALFDLSTILNFSEYIKKYILWKSRFNFNELKSAQLALRCISTGGIVRGVRKSPLDEFGLMVLSTSLLIADLTINGAIILIFSEIPMSGILLRSAMEGGLKGMLFEHMRCPKYKAKIHKRWNEQDTVVKFLDAVEKKSRDLNIPVEEILRDPIQLFSTKSKLSFNDIVNWLNSWGVFNPIPDAVNRMMNMRNRLNQEVHCNAIKIFERGAYEIAALDQILRNVIEIIDILIVGTLNSVRNLNIELVELFEEEELSDVIKSAKEARLLFSEELLIVKRY